MEEGADVEESEEAAEEAAPKKKPAPKGKGKANTSSPQPPPARSVRASPLRDAKRMEDAEKEKKKKEAASRSKRKLADISEAAPSVDDLPDTWDDDFDPSLLVCVSVCISIRTVVL